MDIQLSRNRKGPASHGSAFTNNRSSRHRSVDDGAACAPAGMRILDVGCGAGKQCFLYSDYTKGQAAVVGGDFSEELLDKARPHNANAVTRSPSNSWISIEAVRISATRSLTSYPVPSQSTYAADLKFTFGEAHRVLKNGGRLFVTGPLPENKEMFYQIIGEATQKPIPPMPGSSRFPSIYETIDGLFAKTELLTFENPITFPEVEPFMEYVRASLSEDRKLWSSMFNGPAEYAALLTSNSKRLRGHGLPGMANW